MHCQTTIWRMDKANMTSNNISAVQLEIEEETKIRRLCVRPLYLGRQIQDEQHLWTHEQVTAWCTEEKILALS